MMYVPALCMFICALVWASQALDNGLALTPPMGWLSWLRFGCNTDCQRNATECLSESLVKRTADAMANEGYMAAGYQYVIIDNCWSEQYRDKNGRLVADRTRFPSGMKALSRYVKSKGLKFGLYIKDSLGYEDADVATLAEWEVDYVKRDVGSSPDFKTSNYSTFGKLLNESGRPILYGCSWPAYENVNNNKPDYLEVAKMCNTWRIYGDIQNNWQSLVNIMAWIGEQQNDFIEFAGPGHFNDPDMLIVGNSGLTVDQARVQMALWAILAAPLIMSVDFSTMKPEFKNILLNKDVIAINQDELGIQGRRIFTDLAFRIWDRELSGDARALAFVNLSNAPYTVTFTRNEMKLEKEDYIVQDLFKEEALRTLRATEEFTVKMNATGVKFYKFIRKSSFASENDIEVTTRRYLPEY